jgi:hypothetical protein
MANFKSSDIKIVFFNYIGENTWECKFCKIKRKQDKSKGYTNFISHVQMCHKNWQEIIKTYAEKIRAS